MTRQELAARELLREIASDMKADMREAEGKPLDGALLSVLLGHQAAAIAALARAVESLLPEEEPDRDPVPYKDFLPDEVADGDDGMCAAHRMPAREVASR